MKIKLHPKKRGAPDGHKGATRKISGAHRSELGTQSKEAMMSVILTAEKKGQNPFELVLNSIRNHNLGL